MFELLASVADTLEAFFFAAFLLFMRVGAIVALLPGFGEQFLPMRIRLGVALGLTVITLPAVAPDMPPMDGNALQLALMAASEAGIGLMIGLAFRLLVMALQLAGSIAAQSTALAQIAGVGVMPDPMPAIGNALTIGGLAVAMALDLHVKVVLAIVDSYRMLPAGSWPNGADVATWGVAHAVRAFALAFSLAAPFVVAAFAYNVALGAINRAMPQLMVAFVGAPAITGATLLLLLLSATTILEVWHGTLDRVLASPFGAPG